jgi:tetratricopeptide (TPR) repeat protein
MGLADMALYDGRAADAAAILEKGIKADFDADKKSSAAANKLVALAGASRNRAQAVSAAEQALAINSTAGFAFGAARVLIEAGQDAKAQEIARKMGAELAPELRAWSKLIEGEIQLRRGKSQAAIDLFQEAQKLADTWVGRLDLGRAYLEAGHFPEAASEFDACERRKGEATSVFFDDVPSFRYYPQVYYYRGQVLEGLKSKDAGDLYKTFLTIKSKADTSDPMVADARRRAKALGVAGF